MRYMEEALPVSKKLSKVQVLLQEPCFFVAFEDALKTLLSWFAFFIRGEESACSNLCK